MSQIHEFPARAVAAAESLEKSAESSVFRPFGAHGASIRAAALFQPGRASAWASDCPLASDGQLVDLLHEAQDEALNGIQRLSEARVAMMPFASRDLACAEVALRKAIAAINNMQIVLASVPAEFGEVD